MGVLNRTPDSFFDGGAYLDEDAALERVRRMAAEGADMIDIGGESTRPGALPVSVEEELNPYCLKRLVLECYFKSYIIPSKFCEFRSCEIRN